MVNDEEKNDEEKRVSPVGLLRYAKYYLEAAIFLHQQMRPSGVIDNQIAEPLYYPSCFLASHATELVLKAYLRSKGCSIKSFRNIGHNLEKLLKKCIAKDLANYYSCPQDFILSIEMMTCLRAYS